MLSLYIFIFFFTLVLNNCNSPYFEPFDMETGKVSIATVKATNELLNSGPLLSPPNEVSASKGDYSGYIYISWNSVPNAKKYFIYRSNNPYSNYIFIGESSGTSYKDYTTNETIFYYKISTVNENNKEGDKSEYSSGYISIYISYPSSLSASQGTYTNFIYLSWSSVEKASYYEIYRSTTSYGTYSYIASTSNNYYYDYNVNSDNTYYYKLLSVHSTGKKSSYSGYVSGYLKIELSKPYNFYATKGTYANYVYLTWNTVPYASIYYIERSTNFNGPFTSIGSSSYNYGYDYNATRGVEYYYRVRAYSSTYSIYSPYSDVDSGWRYSYTSTPTNFTATYGIYPDRILLTWDKINNAEYYYIYKSTNATNFYKIATINSITNYFEDFNIIVEFPYYYKISAYNSDNGESLKSSYVIGMAGQDTTSPTLTITWPVNLEWTKNSSYYINGNAYDNKLIEGIYFSVNDENFTKKTSTTNFNIPIDLIFGTNIIKVFAKDYANNSSETNNIYIIYDNIPPVVNFYSPNSNQTIYTTNIFISIMASDNFINLYGVYLSYDSNIFINIGTNSLFSTNLYVGNDGTKNLKLYAIDLAGNYSTTNTITINVLKDTQPPIVNIFSPTNNQEVATNFIVYGTIFDSQSGVSSFALIYHYTNSFLTNSIPINTTNGTFSKEIILNNYGTIYLGYAASDYAGNAVYSINNRLINVANIPIITITSPNYSENTNYITKYTNISIWGEAHINPGNNIDKIIIIINSNTNYIQFTGNPWNFNTNLNDGIYQFQVFATSDNNKSSEIKHFSYSIDTIPPVLYIHSPTNNQYIKKEYFNVFGKLIDTNGVFNSGSRYLFYSINNGFIYSWNYYLENIEIPLYLSNGNYQLSFYGTDYANNVTSNYNININIDTELPIVNIICPDLTNINTIQINFNALDIWSGINNLYFSINNELFKDFSNTSNVITNITLIEGSNIIQSFAIDIAGNIGNTNFATIILDTTGPTVNITSPLETKGTNFTISGISSDFTKVNKVYFSVGGNNWGEVNGTTNWWTNLNLPPTNYNVYIYAIDILGNFSSTNYYNITVNESINAVYVSLVNGNDGYFGTNETQPVRTIPVGLQRLNQFGYKYLFIDNSIYTPGNGLEYTGLGGLVLSNLSNIFISGGWDPNFISKSGYTKLSGNNTLRVLYLITVSNIILEGLQISDGRSYQEYGGGISIISSTNCIITNCIISNNNNNYNYYGGGIYINGRYNKIIDSLLINNFALYHGGGIYIEGNNNLINAKIISNTSSYYYGGGIYLSGNNNTINSEIYLNKSGGNGSGIYIYGDYNTINGKIAVNKCSGAGIFVDSGLENQINAIVVGNWFKNIDGSGGYTYTPTNINEIYSPLYVSLANGNDNNFGTNSSAPIKNIQTAIDRAAIFGYRFIYVDKSGIYRVGTDQGISPEQQSINLNINNIKISGGWEQDFQSKSGYTTISGENIYRPFFIKECTNIFIEGFRVINGRSYQDYGAGLYMLYVTNSTISNCIISNNNNSWNYHGGGIYILGSGNKIMSNIIVNNYAQYYGGGIYILGKYNYVNSLIINNTASYYYGGGIYLQGDNNIIDSEIYLNKSGGNGSGIYIYGDNNTIKGKIAANKANNGAGIYIGSGGDNQINASLVGNWFKNIDGSGGYTCTPTNINEIYSPLYVSLANGNDNNFGTNSSAPIKNIQTAIDRAAIFGYRFIYVDKSGIYRVGTDQGISPVQQSINLNINNIKISGGWEQDFQSKSGYTIISGENIDRSFYIKECTNVFIEGFRIINGRSYQDNGAGLYMLYVTNSTISNCVISNNNNSWNYHGGGIYILGSGNKIMSNIIVNNYAQYSGGGVYILGNNNFISSLILSNSAAYYYGGGIYLSGDNNLIHGHIMYNSAGSSGGGIYTNNYNNDISLANCISNSPNNIN